MAKKKKKTTSISRRSNGGKKGKLMDGLMTAGMVAGGVVLANMIATKLPIADPKMRAGALLVGGIFLAPMVPLAFAPVMAGVSVGGALNMATTLFPQLTQGAARGMGRLSSSQVRMLENAVRSQMNGPAIVGPEIVGPEIVGDDNGSVMFL